MLDEEEFSDAEAVDMTIRSVFSCALEETEELFPDGAGIPGKGLRNKGEMSLFVTNPIQKKLHEVLIFNKKSFSFFLHFYILVRSDRSPERGHAGGRPVAAPGALPAVPLPAGHPEEQQQGGDFRPVAGQVPRGKGGAPDRQVQEALPEVPV